MRTFEHARIDHAVAIVTSNANLKAFQRRVWRMFYQRFPRYYAILTRAPDAGRSLSSLFYFFFHPY